MKIEQYTEVLSARWRTALCVALAVFALGVLFYLTVAPHYKATASVVANLKSSGPLDQTAYPGSLVNNYQATQIAILTSDRVERLVVQDLHLDQRPDMLDKWRSSHYYRADNFLPWAVLWLDKNIKVKAVRAADVINISFSSIDPQFAVDVANAFANVYLKVSLDLNVDPARTSAQWFDNLTDDMRSRLREAQSKLSEFQRDRGIVATDERLDVEVTRLNDLEQQLSAAQGMRADSASKNDQKSGNLEDLPEVLNSAVIATLKTEIAQGQAQLEDMEQRLGTSNPQYTGLKSRLASLRNRETTEIQRIVGSLGSIHRVSVQRETELRDAIATQKGRVLQLRDLHDQAAVLQSDVEAAQKAYDLAAQRQTQSSLEGRIQQTNVAVLSPASLPFKPLWPTIPQVLITSLVFGVLFGVGAAFLGEAANPKIYSAEQLATLGEVPAMALEITPQRSHPPRLRSIYKTVRNIPSRLTFRSAA